jgi:hypothetical protein
VPAVTYAELAASVYKATEEVIGPLSLGDLVFGLQVGVLKRQSLLRNTSSVAVPLY